MDSGGNARVSNARTSFYIAIPIQITGNRKVKHGNSNHF